MRRHGGHWSRGTLGGAVSDNDATLTWDAVSDATNYRYRADSSTWTEASRGAVIADLEQGDE